MNRNLRMTVGVIFLLAVLVCIKTRYQSSTVYVFKSPDPVIDKVTGATGFIQTKPGNNNIHRYPKPPTEYQPINQSDKKLSDLMKDTTVGELGLNRTKQRNHDTHRYLKPSRPNKDEVKQTDNRSSDMAKDTIIEAVTFDQTRQRNNIIHRYLKPPNPYRQMKEIDKKFSQAHQDEAVYELFPMEGGFFIEMGAYNGVQLSNTLWLERKHKWTGLLIEANPELCSQIDKAKRSAWRLCACISTEKNVTFIAGNAMGGVKDKFDSDHLKSLTNRKEVTVPCFTLDKVLTEINVFKIDYFSLDVEGAEMFILGTIKKHLMSEKIVVGIWTIEYRVYDGRKNVVTKSKKNLAKLRQFFREVGGYMEHSQLDHVPGEQVVPDGLALDVVFINVKIWCESHKELPNGSDCEG